MLLRCYGMVIRKASPETDQEARSLLQKAVRRGNAAVASATFRYLATTKGDLTWLRARLGVIAYEEAWPCGGQLTFSKSPEDLCQEYQSLALARKSKDAAGLGALAYALSKGDTSVMRGDESDWPLRVVARALDEKAKFAEWIRGLPVSAEPARLRVVEGALTSARKAGWAWDKAFAYAGALLATQELLPPCDAAATDSGEDVASFPFWVAIDRHTQSGKEAIRKAAEACDVPARTATWISFYFESAVCVNEAPSLWWTRERAWRLSKLGLLESDAERVWRSGLRETLAELVRDDAEALRGRVAPFVEADGLVCGSRRSKETAEQLELF